MSIIAAYRRDDGAMVALHAYSDEGQGRYWIEVALPVRMVSFEEAQMHYKLALRKGQVFPYGPE